MSDQAAVEHAVRSANSRQIPTSSETSPKLIRVEQPPTVADREDHQLVLLDSVDHPVVAEQQLPNFGAVELGHDQAAARQVG